MKYKTKFAILIIALFWVVYEQQLVSWWPRPVEKPLSNDLYIPAEPAGSASGARKKLITRNARNATSPELSTLDREQPARQELWRVLCQDQFLHYEERGKRIDILQQALSSLRLQAYWYPQAEHDTVERICARDSHDKSKPPKPDGADAMRVAKLRADLDALLQGKTGRWLLEKPEESENIADLFDQAVAIFFYSPDPIASVKAMQLILALDVIRFQRHQNAEWDGLMRIAPVGVLAAEWLPVYGLYNYYRKSGSASVAELYLIYPLFNMNHPWAPPLEMDGLLALQQFALSPVDYRQLELFWLQINDGA